MTDKKNEKAKGPAFVKGDDGGLYCENCGVPETEAEVFGRIKEIDSNLSALGDRVAEIDKRLSEKGVTREEFEELRQMIKDGLESIELRMTPASTVIDTTEAPEEREIDFG